jgi:ATP-dependent Clp protease protease subunit
MVPYQPKGSDYTYFVPLSQKFYKDRTLFLGDFLDEAKSNGLIATLLYLREESPYDEITLYFNVPGALIKPSLAVFDVLQTLSCPVNTVNLGLATGMAAFLCAAGTKGRRSALPNARFLLQKTGLDDPFRGQAVDIGLKVADNVADNRRVTAALARLTGRTVDQVHAELGRDFYLSADEAVEYGLIDKVLEIRDKPTTAAYSGRGFMGFNAD